jgi:hypothetical protein
MNDGSFTLEPASLDESFRCRLEVPHVPAHQPLQGRPARRPLRAVRAVQAPGHPRQGPVRELGPGGGRDGARRGLQLVEGSARPAERVGDATGCTLVDGKVKTPAGFKAAWKSLYDVGWRRLSIPEEFGGMAGPFTLHAMAEEIMCGANTAFNMYPALTQGVADVIQHFGTKEQIAAYCTKLHDGTYAARCA